jgi:hypothetical protein
MESYDRNINSVLLNDKEKEITHSRLGMGAAFQLPLEERRDFLNRKEAYWNSLAQR